MRLLTVEELRRIVPLKRSRIYYLTHVGSIPHVKIGRTLFFDEDAIREWVKQQEVNGNGGSDRLPDSA